MAAISGALRSLKSPQGIHKELLLLGKREQIQGCGSGLSKLRLWESLSAASPMLGPQVLRLVLISMSVLKMCWKMIAKLLGFDQSIIGKFKPAAFITPFGIVVVVLEGVCQACDV